MKEHHFVFVAYIICFVFIEFVVGCHAPLSASESTVDLRQGKVGEYHVWVEGEKMNVNYSTNITNQDRTELVVWAIPKETKIVDGEDILITIYFQNTTDGPVFLPSYGAWLARISGTKGTGLRIKEFPGRRHPLADEGIPAGDTLVEEVTLRDSDLGGNFRQINLYFGFYDIAFESVYLERKEVSRDQQE